MTQTAEYPFDLSGGHLALDLVNTVSWRASAPTERLRDYRDLVAWSRQAGAVTDEQAARLLLEAERHPAAAADAHARVAALRETLFRICDALLDGRRPAAADLAALNRALSEVLEKLRLAPGEGGLRWEWAGAEEALDRMLWPAVREAADLLTSDAWGAVRRCAAPDCGWLFLDVSRNRTRRWCDMKICGNRAKVRRHYAKQKTDAP